MEAFTWDVADGLPLMIKDGSTNFVTGLGGLPLEEITSSGAVHYYDQDQLGSTVALTDSTGTRIGSQSYSAYGTIASSSGVAPVLAYAGQYRDPESGLYYLRARYYDANSGQFISRDPIVSVSRQTYQYAVDSPLNSGDASGLWPNWQAGWNALATGAKDVGRQALIQGLTAAANWVGQEHDDLNSGDPMRVMRGVVGVVLVVSMVIPGGGEAVDAGAIAVRGFGEVRSGTIAEDAVLPAAQRWLGSGCKEIDNGVFRSADNARQFRMTDSDLAGREAPHVPYESIGSNGRTITESSKVYIQQ